MGMTATALVTALTASDKTSIIHVRSSKPTFAEILNDIKNFQNNFAALEFDSTMSVQSGGATRLVIAIDRNDSTPSNSPAGEQLFQGATVATLARRV